MLEGAQAVFLGGIGFEMRSSDSGPATLFWRSIFAWGAQFLLGGEGRAQAVIWEGTDPKCSHGAGPTLYIFANPIVMQLSRRVFQTKSHPEKL